MVSPLVQEHISFDGDGVAIRDPTIFDSQVSAARLQFLNDSSDVLISEIRTSTSKFHNQKRKGRLEHIHRLAQVWSPFNRRITLSALRAPFGSRGLIREPSEIAHEISKAWAPVFAQRNLNVEKARELIDCHSATFRFQDCHPPSVAAIARTARGANNSKAGPDGIPYAGWAMAGHKAHETLYLVALWLASGLRMPLDFNDSVTVFPPKGQLDSDLDEVIRDPFGVRPISLKNTDNKIIGAARNFKVSDSVAAGACHLRGDSSKAAGFLTILWKSMRWLEFTLCNRRQRPSL